MNGRILCLAALVMFGFAPAVRAQIGTPPGITVGTVGNSCSGSTVNYGWPDVSGKTIQCVSNVWTAVGGGAASAGGSDKQVQYNNGGKYPCRKQQLRLGLYQ